MTKQQRSVKDPTNHIKYIIERTPKEINQYNNNITIETITNLSELKHFYQLPLSIYKKNPNWVAPFWKEIKDFFKTNNPYWKHADTRLYLAKENNTIVGRIAATIDQTYIQTEQKKTGFFGFFESINQPKVAEALLKTAENWLQTQNMTHMQGPIDGRIDNGCGFLIQGHNTPTSLLSTYSQPYYIKFVEQNNMKKIRDLIIYNIDLTKPLQNIPENITKKIKQNGITIHPFSRFHTQKQLNQWIDIFLETFKDHWGYIPVTPDEVKTRFGIKQIRLIIDPKLFLIAKKNNQPIAYIWTTPDYNQLFKIMNGKLGVPQLITFILQKRTINQGKHHLIGIKKQYRDQNLGTYLTYLTLKEMKKRGYLNTEIGWIDEQNTIVHKIIKNINGQIHKKYRVYEKPLTPNH